ncbi:MAG: CvpA family protein [Chloroflexi bacterium OHK40]
MALSILVVALIAVLAIVGLFRGVRRGLLALGGTLLAAVLVDLWDDRISTWLRDTVRPEQPALPLFLLLATVFLLVAFIVGYGGSAMLPRPDPRAKQPPPALDRLLGALLGALNGALLGSYLLRYAVATWPDQTVSNLLATAPVASLLITWLPWFVLAMVGTTTLFVVIRVAVIVARNRAATAPPRATAAPGASPTPPPPPPASVPEMDKRVNEKINQALGKK